MDKVLTDKIALVTGGNSGIGYAVAQRFIEAGARVILIGRRASAVEEAAISLGAAHGIACDIQDAAALQEACNQIREQFGRLDIVFANAGVVDIAPLADVTIEQYNNVFDTCVKGTLFTVQAVVPLMTEGGSIILNGAAIANKGIEGLGLNAAAKSAVRSFGRTLAAELAPKNIRVNTVSPGTISTPLLQKSGMTPEAVAHMNSQESPIPLRRLGRPDEMAAAVLFLASDESSYITGIDMPVDGGAMQV